MANPAPSSRSSVPTTPPEGAAVTPHLSGDHSFTLQAVMEMQKALGGLTKQIEGMDSRLEKLREEVSKHGKWLYAANVVLGIGVVLISYIAKIVWDIAKVKLGLPP